MKRTVTLDPEVPGRESRQEIVFNADGPLVGPRLPQGRWPLFSGGDIFEVWSSLVFPSPEPIEVTVIRFPASNPNSEAAQPLGTFVIPAGVYVYVHSCEWDIGRGDQVSFGIGMETVEESPGSGLLLVARVS